MKTNYIFLSYPIRWLSIIMVTTFICPSASLLAENTKSRIEFPLTDFSKTTINFSEIRNDGINRDSIPSIYKPKFLLAKKIRNIGENEPVISLEINGDSRAYPLRVLVWHELINDFVGNEPILVSFSPLCNSAIIFSRRLNGQILDFQNTGRTRHFNTVMFDSNSESWWQQFSGESIIGSYSGEHLSKMVSRRESFKFFKAHSKYGKVMVPKNPEAHKYGTTPFVRMDSQNDLASKFPYTFPKGIKPIEQVVVVENNAWPLALLTHKRRILKENILLLWNPGQNSIYDTYWIPFGRDIGNITIKRKIGGDWVDALYDTAFAFTVAAIKKNIEWHLK